MTTNRIVFHTVVQKRSNWTLFGSNSCWYQRAPTNGPSKLPELLWRLSQNPRKKG